MYLLLVVDKEYYHHHRKHCYTEKDQVNKSLLLAVGKSEVNMVELMTADFYSLHK